jgi:hypothetical protein
MDKTKCRVCNGALRTVLNLGKLYISDFVSNKHDGIKAPHVLGKCKNCGLVQLKHTMNLDSLYKRQYWYRSGLNKSMLNDLRDIVKDIESRITLNNHDIVMDIGCNDGSLFDYYSNSKLYKIGFDPAPNLKEIAETKCNLFINDFFYLQAYPFQLSNAKVITTIAMFYDLPDPNEFTRHIACSLHKEGIWVIQFTDLLSMLKVNAIDNICAEHLEYYTLNDINNIVNKWNLEIFDVSYNRVNGGSIRIFVGHKGKFKVTSMVNAFLHLEKSYLAIDNLKYLYTRIKLFKRNIKSYIKNFNNVYGLAASTKGNTLLQIFDLSNNDIKAIGEVNKDKFGLMTVGTNIPIIPEQDVLDANPDLIIIMAWHFKSTFDVVLKEYIKNGGIVLYPLPLPMIVTNKGEFYLG